MEVSPEGRPDSEQIEKLRRDKYAVDLLGFPQARQTESVPAQDSHGGKAAVVRTPVEKIRKGDRPVLEISLALVQPNELFRVRIRERVKQHAIDDGKNRGVGADPQ